MQQSSFKLLTNTTLAFTPHTNNTALCGYCDENNCILPSAERFQDRLGNPTLQLVFYDYMLRPIIGDTRWKECISNNERMGTACAEAFAHMLLKNNYNAWYADYKSRIQGDLKCDYDVEIDENGGPVDEEQQKDLCETIMPDIAIAEEEDAEGKSIFTLLQKDPQEQAEDGATIQELKQKFKDTRDECVERRDERVKNIRDEPKNQERVAALKEVTKVLIEINANEEDVSKKKRKVIRKLKHFTAARTQDTDRDAAPRKRKTPRKSKGWSPKANKFFADMVMDIKQDVASGRLGRWEELYRDVARKRDQKAAAEAQDGSDEEDDHQVNCADIYELELVAV